MDKYITLKNLHTTFPTWDIETLFKIVDSIQEAGIITLPYSKQWDTWYTTWCQNPNIKPGSFTTTLDTKLTPMAIAEESHLARVLDHETRPDFYSES